MNIEKMIATASRIEIISGEGDGPESIETFTGARTTRAINARLARERCGGDRWAKARVITSAGTFDFATGEQAA